MTPPRAVLSADRMSVTLVSKPWRETFMIEKLDARIAFYEGLRDAKAGRYADTYQPTVDVLKAVRRRLGDKMSPQDAPSGPQDRAGVAEAGFSSSSGLQAVPAVHGAFHAAGEAIGEKP